MNFTVDSHFVMGRAHMRKSMPCQDYARTGTTGTGAYIIISDGCSSGGETDIGSRILALAAEQVLRSIDPKNTDRCMVQDRIVAIANDACAVLGLNRKDMQATLAYALITSEGGFIHLFGDGCIVILYTDGSQRIYQFAWEQNKPYYPIYLQEKDRISFLAHHADDVSPSLVISETYVTVDGAEEVVDTPMSALDGAQGFGIALSPEALEMIQAIFLSSDGVEQFKGGDNPGNTKMVLQQLTSVKLWHGAFIKRRMSRMVSDLEKERILPDDDVAVAALYINQKTHHYDSDNTRSAQAST